MNATLTSFASVSRSLITAGIIAGSVAVPDAARAEPKLELRVHRVTCLRETSCFPIGRAGKDNVVLTGVALPAAGPATRIKTIEVGKFDSLDSHPVSKTFTAISLPPGASSAEAGVVFILAETHIGGGVGRYADKLVNEINEERKKAAADAVKNLPPGTAAAVPPIVVAALKAAAVKLREVAIERARKAAEDDIFPDRIAATKLTGTPPRFKGGKVSSGEQTVVFNGDGGRYIVTYSWRVVG